MPYLKVNRDQKAIVKAIANTWHNGNAEEALEGLLSEHRRFRNELDGYKWPLELPGDLDDLMEKIAHWGREEFRFPLGVANSVWLSADEIFSRLENKWSMPEGYRVEDLHGYLVNHLYEQVSSEVNGANDKIFSTRHKFELRVEDGVDRFRYSPAFEKEFNKALTAEMALEEL